MNERSSCGIRNEKQDMDTTYNGTPSSRASSSTRFSCETYVPPTCSNVYTASSNISRSSVACTRDEVEESLVCLTPDAPFADMEENVEVSQVQASSEQLMVPEAVDVEQMATSSATLFNVQPLLQSLAPSNTPKALAEEGKKRKGGWPKGKKRKPQKDVSAPRAPTTGDVLFLNEQREKMKRQNPNLHFTEITKLLGSCWSQLSTEEKQKYTDEAERDRQRYVEELKAYQNSDAYQAFCKRRAIIQMKSVCETSDTVSNERSSVLPVIEDDGGNRLHCRTCNQYFSSLHNKKEHLLGRQHLQNLTGEFEKETTEVRQWSVEDEQMSVSSMLGFQHHHLTSLNLNLLQENILHQMHLCANETQELHKALQVAQDETEALGKELERLKARQMELEVELDNQREWHSSLEEQFDSLQAIPALVHLRLPSLGSALCLGLQPPGCTSAS
uniref:HMG box domain-containing protein n=1 Tax=Eptatretus burgeri TaxID=7764 RepID=A0A8C4Q8P7_EPTBU